jgi:hypothetical protein
MLRFIIDLGWFLAILSIAVCMFMALRRSIDKDPIGKSIGIIPMLSCDKQGMITSARNIPNLLDG